MFKAALCVFQPGELLSLSEHGAERLNNICVVVKKFGIIPCKAKEGVKDFQTCRRRSIENCVNMGVISFAEILCPKNVNFFTAKKDICDSTSCHSV